MTVNTRVIQLMCAHNTQNYIEIPDGLQIQVLSDMSQLVRAQKHHFAAFIADRGILVVWDDDPKKILDRVVDLEKRLMKAFWKDDSAYPDEDWQADEKIDAETYASEDGSDVEVQVQEPPRKLKLTQAFLTAITIALTLSAIGAGWREITIEMVIDPSWIRMAFILAIIPQFWLALVGHRNPKQLVRRLLTTTSSSSRPLQAISLKSSAQLDS
jgi:hypothetical protein